MQLAIRHPSELKTLAAPMLPFHPLADVLPLIKRQAFAELVASIRFNGLHDAIVTLDGMILDGRNRYLACLEADVQPRFEEFAGVDPVAFVTDKNLRRRHLTSGQKAMAVAKYAALSVGCPKSKLIDGMPAIRTTAEVAAMVGVNKGTISDAKIIIAHGTPEQIEAVSNGTGAVTTVAKKVRVSRDASGKGAYNGCRIKVPDGKTMTGWISEGIALQKAGTTLPVVVDQLGIAVQSYSHARDIILLSQRKDLGKKDTAIVAKALRQVEETHQLIEAWPAVEPIVRRVWGHNGGRFTADKRRTHQFDNAITFLLHTTENAVDMEIPQLSQNHVTAAAQQLSDAIDALSKLKSRIQGIGHD